MAKKHGQEFLVHITGDFKRDMQTIAVLIAEVKRPSIIDWFRSPREARFSYALREAAASFIGARKIVTRDTRPAAEEAVADVETS